MNSGDACAISTVPTADDLYRKGGKTIQAGAGYLVSPLLIETDRRKLNYAITFVRLGYLLTDLPNTNSFRGEFRDSIFLKWCFDSLY
jgi:hypothetical protein